MGGYEERIAKVVLEKVGNKLADEFEKIQAELKKMIKYMNELDARIEKLEGK